MLAPGDIYISPLDLNVEHGRIETPCKSVMRLGTPIFAAWGTAAGTVALNELGLGLAIVHRILDQHQDSIRLHPNPPPGTCATVLLPAVPEKAEASTNRKPLARLEF